MMLLWLIYCSLLHRASVLKSLMAPIFNRERVFNDLTLETNTYVSFAVCLLSVLLLLQILLQYLTYYKFTYVLIRNNLIKTYIRSIICSYLMHFLSPRSKNKKIYSKKVLIFPYISGNGNHPKNSLCFRKRKP